MNLQNGLENVRGCNEWNTFFEEKIKKETSNLLVKGENSKKSAIPRSLNEVVGKDATRIAKYIQNQLKEDQELCQLELDLDDPFKGNK